MKKKPLKERQLVNLLVKALKKNSPGIYIHVDRDSGAMRHTSSGWDFLAAMNGKVVFCECKIENGKLTDWQKLVRTELTLAKVPHEVLRFSADVKAGDIFTITGFGCETIKLNEVNAAWLGL